MTHKTTANGQRKLAEAARKAAAKAAPLNTATARFWSKVARAHEAEARRGEKS